MKKKKLELKSERRVIFSSRTFNSKLFLKLTGDFIHPSIRCVQILKYEKNSDNSLKFRTNADALKKFSDRKEKNENKTKENNNGLINNSIKKLDNLEKNIDEMNKKFSDFKTDYENIKVKVEDFNIYDLFKGEGANGGNIDAAKSLVMALENKVFKKFSYYDDRYKTFDKDIFKIKKENK